MCIAKRATDTGGEYMEGLEGGKRRENDIIIILEYEDYFFLKGGRKVSLTVISFGSPSQGHSSPLGSLFLSFPLMVFLLPSALQSIIKKLSTLGTFGICPLLFLNLNECLVVC